MRRGWRKIASALAAVMAASLLLTSGLLGVGAAFADTDDDEAAEIAINGTGITASVDYLTAPTAASTAAMQATYGWDACENAVLVPADCGSLVLCAATLAGTFDCPLLVVDAAGIPEAETLNALTALGTKNVYIVAPSSFDTSLIKTALQTQAIPNVVLLQGATAVDTSTLVMRYGTAHGLWQNDQVIFANSADADAAIALETVAYQKKIPVLLTAADGKLTSSQRAWLASSDILGDIQGATLIGTPGAVSNDVLTFAKLASPDTTPLLARRVEGDATTLAAYAAAQRPISTDTLLMTDTTQASYLSTQIFALHTGMEVFPIEGLDVYQTSVDLLNDDVTHQLFTCEGDPVDEAERDKIGAVVDRINRTGQGQRATDGCNVTYWAVGMKLSAAAEKQVGLSVNDDWEQVDADEIAINMDPTATPIGTTGFFQFLDLSGGYTGLITADQLDDFIESYVPAIEAATGYTSPFHGMGSTLIQAARESNINEVYLLAHAIVECGAGCSEISTLGGYYNFYGIAAYDSNPYASGDFAEGQGWDTAEAAILGGAAWISEHYVNSAAYRQNTVYQMRWCVPNANHEYCSANSFPVKVGAMMEKIYAYAGVDVTNAGFSFSIPVYD